MIKNIFMLKTVVLLNIFVETLIQDSMMNRKKKQIEKVEIFCNIRNNLYCQFW